MSEVRIATPPDREAMIPLLYLMHEENGVATLDVPKMLFFLDKGLHRDKAIIGVIEEDGLIKAAIGLFLHQWWYSSDYHLEDTFAFVHPEYRQSTFAKSLLKFARKAADDLGVQLLIGILSSDRTAAKIKLYEKEFGPSMGAGFVYPNPRADEVVKVQVKKKRRPNSRNRFSGNRATRQQVAAE
jgi:GNAT superfamily N-acetyltransferase